MRNDFSIAGRAAAAVIVALMLGACGASSSQRERAPGDGQGGSSQGGGAGVAPQSGSDANGGSADPAGQGAAAGVASPMGGAGGSAGDGEDGGGTAGASGAGSPEEPSAGCELGNATPGTQLEHFDRGTRVRLPSGYDGSTPFPVLFAFHETGSPASGVIGDVPAEHPIWQTYVVVAPATDVQPGGFEYSSLADFTPLVDEVLATLCVDRNAIFAVGLNSGGRYVGTLLNAGDAISSTPRPGGVADQFRAAAIIGSYSGTSRWPAVPLVFIHGADSVDAALLGDPDGASALSTFIANNACETSSVPVDVAGCESYGVTVNPGCIDLSGCSAPLRFCRHDDPDPRDRNSGWPCFASDQVYELFENARR
jgi:hypothetical protein